MYDCLIIGAGVIGAMTARELTRYQLKIGLLEKEADVSCGASKANSGIIHGGYDPVPGTMKARMNAQGVPLLYEAAKELNVPYQNNGSLVVAFDEPSEKVLQELLERGRKNGVEGLACISGEEARQREPALSDEVTACLSVPTGGIICPYALTVAAAGNAMDNGADLFCGFEVTSLTRTADGFSVGSADGRVMECRYLVNCAGTASGAMAALAGHDFFHIIPRAGEYLLLDKEQGNLVHHTIFQAPTAAGKGILVTPTADGNLLTGPTAHPVESDHDTATTPSGLETVMHSASKSVPGIAFNGVITSFAGVRASAASGDFILCRDEKIPGLIHAGAIDSPGLTSCVASARYLVTLLEEEGLALALNPSFNGNRADPFAFRKMKESEKDAWIQEHPDYGTVVCRCETVSEGEIRQALRTNPPANDLDGVKRRTRSGMGRCQGGFCAPHVMDLIAQERGIPKEKVTKKGGNSFVVTGRLGQEDKAT